MEFVWEYVGEKKLDEKTTQMAHVKVYDLKGKLLETATCSKWQEPEDVADMLIREYSLRKVFNSKAFAR